MIEQLRPRIVPKKEWGGEIWFEGTSSLPVLVKLIFTVAKLSVQVHPDDAYAQAQGYARGKTEMWHVLAAQAGAKIAAGFRETVSEERVRAASLSGEIVDLLAWQEARPGDTFFLPAGTVHAIGEGLVLYEIQQNCDITYRLYDYGRDRELHLHHALKVSHRGPMVVRRQAREGVLVSCEYFTTEKIRLKEPRVHVPAGDEIWIALEGSGEVEGAGFQAGEVFSVRGTAQTRLSGDAWLLRVATGPQ